MILVSKSSDLTQLLERVSVKLKGEKLGSFLEVILSFSGTMNFLPSGFNWGQVKE